MRGKKLNANLLFGLICYSLIVFLWGAWVRISGSGDGCGEHWPFCYGVLIPESSEIKLLIENFHRISTKAYGFYVMGLIGLLWKTTDKGHAARKWILWTFFFTLLEGLIGAIIVLKGLVTDDESSFRAVMMSIHLTNTFLLMGSIVICWHVVRFDTKDFQLKLLRSTLLLRVAVLLVVTGALGALAALSTTLFPSTSLIDGLAKDLSSESHWLLRVRAFHPILAIGLLVYVINQSFTLPSSSSWTKRLEKNFKVYFALNVVIGFTTLGLLSPTILKLSHLFVGHLMWIYLVLLICERCQAPNGSYGASPLRS